MNRVSVPTAAALALVTLLSAPDLVSAQDSATISLPSPDTNGGGALTRALAARRSVRALAQTPLSLAEVAQLLWAAQGVTEAMPSPPPGWQSAWGRWHGGLRTAPSAGALYPLELYLLATSVEGLEHGVYRYIPEKHALVHVGNCAAADLAGAALGQRAIAEASAVVVLTAVYDRTARKYRDRAPRYVHIEVGAAAENLLLQATSLGLGTVFIGAFQDEAVQKALGLPKDHAPLGIVPVGHRGS